MELNYDGETIWIRIKAEAHLRPQINRWLISIGGTHTQVQVRVVEQG